MLKKKLIDTPEKMMRIIESFERIPIKTVEVNLKKSLEIAWRYKIYAYDAFYLETAERLNIPLLIFDSGMKRIGKELGINILGGYNASI
jgi:predicted nucleic acid-binding protein